MSTPRPSGLRDRGSVTVEAALGISVLVVVLAMCLGGIGAAVTQIRCADAAREAVRLAGRGDPAGAAAAAARIAPDGASLSLSQSGDLVTASVSAPALGGLLPSIRVSSSSVAAIEEELGGG